MFPSFLKKTAAKNGSYANEISSSITINSPAERLFALWRKPETLPILMGHFASIDILNHTDSNWRINTPIGALIEWQARIIDEKPGEYIHWRSLEGARVPNEGQLYFRPVGTETVVTLTIRYNPPGGLIGKKIGQMFDLFSRDMLTKTLYRFKKLAEDELA
ncbi:SRPBCC family protein [Samsonia erythrinae]|uniref:Polyketide cyclase/dehydrase/lipid transport protein n=1 Tax=Samsonia erythrinae TaxID=160434 RepID=A0A4R3VF00_9GAMM|nr:SRPBCC family protein [Samsonia erythrinae]TCV02219.1 polyketide cyclase/dehydrase/lipid transport protein [Samsonia erythrinae]